MKIEKLSAIFLLCLLAVTLFQTAGCGKKEKVVPEENFELAGSETFTGAKVMKSPASQKTSSSQNSSPGKIDYLPWKNQKDSSSSKNPVSAMNAEFNRQYTNGIEQLEKDQLNEALSTFEDIVNRYPGTDEASLAEYRIAQIHFRNKSNHMALQAYKKLVEKYPNSPVSENAKAAITYLETFEQHEKNYVSPDVEDRKRQGR
ncbi:MAG: outer membrane protein assembly factor BamD [Candidatus Riflebacteria bacterium]|nr:outer membrane protein assembly factor BamD [Candidatus Riflebacteria bacterium]